MTSWVEKLGWGRLGHPVKPGDVGYDLYVVVTRQEQTLIERFLSALLEHPVQVIWPLVGVRTLRSAVHISMPDGLWCEIRPRSSTSRKKLHVLGGTIDSGYQGELYTVLHNLGLVPRIIRDGERYAQVVFHNACRPKVEVVSEFDKRSIRGHSGFGSTGA